MYHYILTFDGTINKIAYSVQLFTKYINMHYILIAGSFRVSLVIMALYTINNRTSQ